MQSKHVGPFLVMFWGSSHFDATAIMSFVVSKDDFERIAFS